MITDDIVPWIKTELSLTRVYLGTIPQNVDTYPAVVVLPPDEYDHGNTALAPVAQKMLCFKIRVIGTTFSSLATIRTDLIDLFAGIPTRDPTPVTIGSYRCQSILVRDCIADSGLTTGNTTDRKIPGAVEQGFNFYELDLLASYH